MRVAVLALGAMAGAVLAAERRNTFEIPVQEGYAEVEWLSASSFRFLRTRGGPERWRRPVNPERVAVERADAGRVLRFTTRYVTLLVDKNGDGLTVRRHSGLLQAASIGWEGGRAVLEAPIAGGERFYGLGPRRAGRLDARGSLIETKTPFLISNAGYGQYFTAGREAYTFDLGKTRPGLMRVVMPGGRIEFAFYFGPTPKEILEEHRAFAGGVQEQTVADLAVRESPRRGDGDGTWASLSASLQVLLNGSLSGVLLPSFDVAPYEGASAGLRSSAEQLGRLMPFVYAAGRGPERRELLPYLQSYTHEAWERGLPVIRPLPLEFPEDAMPDRTDEFMFGDELLIVPVLSAGGALRPYLPRGIWTDLRTNAVYQGRREITLDAHAMIMLARNGSIVPLARAGVLELHYFPRLGAEFFLYEEQQNDISQFHAAPAGDLLRLETESLAERTCEWVVHHSGPCGKVDCDGVVLEQGTGPGRWHYDPSRDNLHVRIRARDRADHVIHISPEVRP